MDEEQVTQTPAENTEAVEENSQTTSPVDEQTTSDSQDTEGQTSSAEESSGETQGEPERKPTRAERRIRQLNDKVKDLERTNQPFQGFQQPPQLEPDESGEISRQQLEQYVAQEAENRSSQVVQQALAQERAKLNFERDAETLPNQFPELDESNSQYTKELEEAISQEFQEKAFRVVGVDPISGQPQYALDPSVRLSDIAKRYVNSARALANKSSADMRNAVAKTADTAAIKPSGEVPRDKSPSDMSIEEMEAKLGFHNI